MKSLRNLIRILLVLLGTGIGAAIAATGVSLFRMASPDREIDIVHVALVYVIACLLFSLLFLFFSDRMAEGVMRFGSDTYHRIEEMPLSQFFTAITCMVIGLIVAVLVATPVHYMGSSIFTTVLSSLITIALGAFGYTIGYRRSDDCIALLHALTGYTQKKATRRKIRRASKKAQDRPAQPYLLDTSSLIDGRVLDLSKKGFLSGSLVVPDFVIEELQHMADATDPTKRNRAVRGLDMLKALQETPQIHVRTLRYEADDTLDVDVRLLRMSRDLHAPIITCDNALTKAALVSELSVLNLHELATLMRPMISAGDILTVQIIKEGRERNQGIGYLDDGTMIVVEETRTDVGLTVDAEVTSALQTSAGRMIFARKSNAA